MDLILSKSFLQHKQEKALQQAMHTMNKRVNIERNRVFHFEDSMIMYGVYNVDTFEKLIQMVHKMNTKLVWFEHRTISPTYESDGLGKQTVSTHIGL